MEPLKYMTRAKRLPYILISMVTAVIILFLVWLPVSAQTIVFSDPFNDLGNWQNGQLVFADWNGGNVSIVTGTDCDGSGTSCLKGKYNSVYRDITVSQPSSVTVEMRGWIRSTGGFRLFFFPPADAEPTDTIDDYAICQRQWPNPQATWRISTMTCELEPGTYRMALVFGYQYGGSSADSWVDWINVSVESLSSPTPGLTPTIPLTYTCYINASNPSQGANLIQNGSFEDSADGGYTPDNWASNPGIIIANDYWKEIPAQAADGEDYLLHRLQPSASIYQVVEILTDTQVLVGTAFRSPIGSGSASMSFTPPVSGSLYMTSTTNGDWKIHEFTTTLTAGNYTLNLNVPDTSSNGESAAFDLVYMFPVTGAGISVWCPFFNTIEAPTPPPSGTGSIVNYPAWSGSGAYCKTCPVPSSLLQIGAWLGWLGCVLTNLFFCWLETWLANIFNIIGAFAGWMAVAWNALMTVFESVWALFLMVWEHVVNFMISSFWQFANFVVWATNIVLTVIEYITNQITYSRDVYTTELVNAFWGGTYWIAQAILNGVAWLWSVILTFSSWLVDRFWDVVSYLDPLALLVWFLKLPFIQAILSALSYFGIGGDAARIVLYAVATVMMDIYDALLELWSLLRVVVNAFRDSWGDEPYKIFLNVNGEDVDTVAPGELYATGANATKILWLGLAAVASIDYAVEIFPLELPLWLAIGGLSFVVVMWTLNLWKEVLPFG